MKRPNRAAAARRASAAGRQVTHRRGFFRAAARAICIFGAETLTSATAGRVHRVRQNHAS